MENQPFSVSEALALINQTLDYAYPVIVVDGEVANFKVNQNKFVFFDIKDSEGMLGCFMTVFQLGVALEDGMKVRVVAAPKLTKWGKFSLTVRAVMPIGEGSIKRNYELQKEKFAKEGLFDDEHKRSLPMYPEHIAVVSSTGAAGYADFIKIVSQRWPGIEISVYNVSVQGESAPAQIAAAVKRASEAARYDAIAVVRGGGAREDLAAFDDETVVRAIAGSRAPVITGIGHEVDETLADLVADIRASTPSNAAEILVPEKREVQAMIDYLQHKPLTTIERLIEDVRRDVRQSNEQFAEHFERTAERYRNDFTLMTQIARQYDPRVVLQRGYALVRAADGALQRKVPDSGELLHIETAVYKAVTEVKNVEIIR